MQGATRISVSLSGEHHASRRGGEEKKGGGARKEDRQCGFAMRLFLCAIHSHFDEKMMCPT